MDKIVGIDIGHISSIAYSKEGAFITESRLAEATRLDELGENEIFEFNHKKYVTNSGTFENGLVKHEKNNFLNLLYYLISKATYHNNVSIVIGVPAGQYSEKRDELRNFILQHNTAEIRLGRDYDNLNDVRHICINDVFVVPEGYGLKTKAEIFQQCKKGAQTFIIDIGGGTTDIAIFNPNNKFLRGGSIKYGLLDIYNNTRKVINKKFNTSISLEDAKKYFDKDMELVDSNFEYREELLDFGMSKILSDLRLDYPELEASNIILTGGAAGRMYDTFKSKYPQIILADDITLNAEGFFKIGVKKWLIK